MGKEKIIIGISQGDINGIGYEVILKTFSDPRMMEMCIPVVYGSPKVAAYHRKALHMDTSNLNTIHKPSEANTRKINIIDCISEDVRVELGKITAEAGEASYLALEAAVKALKTGEIDALVTAPICKNNIQSDKFKFPGHTEYLASQFSTDNYLMLMISDLLKVGLVTTHIPVSEISSLITEEAILKKLRIMEKSMIQDFNIDKPKIAVLSLNPHAGDGGLLGNEEKEIIIPAIEKARKEGIIATGPFPTDGFFGSELCKSHDAVLAMYHDHGLGPFKALSFDRGINFTAGLPVIRTSPDHGTAFDIAGEGIASPASFREAIYAAIDIYRNRAEYNEITKNPLKISNISQDEENHSNSTYQNNNKKE